MPPQPDLFTAEDATADLLSDLLATAPQVLVKKLSNNDRDWAQKPNKHQAGVYIPVEQRDSGFFPPLATRESDNPAADPIREVFFRIEWPQLPDRSETRLVNYTSKGAETHMTRLPRAAFSQLGPASWLVMAPKPGAAEPAFVCLTIDSASDAAELLETTLGLAADFVVGVVKPGQVAARERDLIMGFAEAVAAAWLGGDIATFAANRAAMPPTVELATMARSAFLQRHGMVSLDPFAIDSPGDAIREISRVIEWDLFRDFQRKERAVELVRSIFGDEPKDMDMKSVIRRMVDSIGEIDRIMLSASQQRKSRAGYSFEHQIEAMLEAGGIPFGKQVVIEAKRRPDFVLPSLKHLRAVLQAPGRGLILSAKTTLRERWKQVEREMGGSDLFLATVDETIAANVIEEMSSMGITLVVPESLKRSGSTEYVRHANVVDFSSFFAHELRQIRMPAWASQ